MKVGTHMKYRLVVICLCLLFAVSGCQKEESEEYILPLSSQYFLGKLSYDEIKDNNSDTFPYAESVEVDGDFLIIEVTPSQVDNIIENNLKLMEEIETEFLAINDDFSIRWSEDYSTVEFNVNYEGIITDDVMETLGNLSHSYWINSILLTNRILVSKDSDIAITVIYKNADSGHIIAKALFPYETISMTDEDFKLSESQDVLMSSEYLDYFDMQMIVKEVSDDKIIFTPQDNDSFYIDDKALSLCLDSVYAEDVTLPYKVEVGDVYIVRVNGNYALHDDGDDIPDIAPVAIIPEDYYAY